MMGGDSVRLLLRRLWLQERNALESMRQEFEAELQAARMEVSKAQEALASSEDRIRTAEQVGECVRARVNKIDAASVRSYI